MVIRRRVQLGAAALAVFVQATPAVAQPSAALEEIVVTARKRAENLNDVPLAITAFSEAMLDRRGISTLASLAAATPNLTFTQDSSGALNVPVLRGLATVDGRAFDNATGLFIDGFYVSGRSAVTLEMFELERVEVVKGPQSALYGRNTFAGAINYVTKNPSDEIEGKLVATVGQFNTQKLAASISGPLVEGRVAARFGAVYDQSNGTYSNNTAVGPRLGGPGGTRVKGGLGGHEYKTVSGTVRFTPSDLFEVFIRGYYSDDLVDSMPNGLVLPNCGRGGGTATRPLGPQYYCGEVLGVGRNDLGLDPRAFSLDRKIGRYSVELNYEVPGVMTITSATAYNDVENVSQIDLDRKPGGDGGFFYATGPATAPGLNPAFLQAWPAAVVTGFPAGMTLPTFFNSNDTDSKNWAQEIRLRSDGDGPLSWIAGVFYYHFKNDNISGAVADGSGFLAGSARVPAGSTLVTIPFAFGPQPPPVFFGPRFFTTNVPNVFLLSTDGTLRNILTRDRESDESIAVYGQVEYAFSDRLRGTAEARYTHEKRTNNGIINCFTTTLRGNIGIPNCNGTTGPGDGLSRGSWNMFDPRFTLDYRATDDALIYLSAAHGSKSGGINQAVAGLQPRLFDPERNWTYELGAKASLADGRVTMNTSVFVIDWTDMQIRTSIPGANLGSFTGNVSGVTSEGFEIEVEAAPIDGVTLAAGYGYNDAKFKNDAVNAALSNTCSAITEPGFPCSTSIGGKRLVDSSRHTMNGMMRYTRPIGQDMNWFAQLDVSYKSKLYVDQLNLIFIKGRAIGNARAGIATDTFDLTAWVTNFTDDDTPSRGGLFGTNLNILTQTLTVTYAPRRQFGITGTYRF